MPKQGDTPQPIVPARLNYIHARIRSFTSIILKYLRPIVMFISIILALLSYIVVKDSKPCFISFFCKTNPNYHLNSYLIISLCIFFILFYLSSRFRRIAYKLSFFILLIIFLGIFFYNKWYFYDIPKTHIISKEITYLCTSSRGRINAFSINEKTKNNITLIQPNHHNTFDFYSTKFMLPNSLIQDHLGSLGISNDHEIVEIYMLPALKNPCIVGFEGQKVFIYLTRLLMYILPIYIYIEIRPFLHKFLERIL